MSVAIHPAVDRGIQKGAADFSRQRPRIARFVNQAKVRLVLRRRIAEPISPKPPSIMTQLAVSGTAAEKVAVPE